MSADNIFFAWRALFRAPNKITRALAEAPPRPCDYINIII